VCGAQLIGGGRVTLMQLVDGAAQPRIETRTRTSPPRSVNFNALVSRLKSTCLSFRSSASTVPALGSTSSRRLIPLRVARSRIRAAELSTRYQSA